MSGPAARSYLVAASIGAVEALKDQGFARWNYAFRSVNQHLNIRRYSYGGGGASKAAASSSSASEVRKMVGRTVMSKEGKVEGLLKALGYLSSSYVIFSINKISIPFKILLATLEGSGFSPFRVSTLNLSRSTCSTISGSFTGAVCGKFFTPNPASSSSLKRFAHVH